jgi:hypothetical protein
VQEGGDEDEEQQQQLDDAAEAFGDRLDSWIIWSIQQRELIRDFSIALERFFLFLIKN